MTNEFYSLPEDCDFSKVKNNSSQENDCSPKLEDKYFSSFKGIAINLPKTIVWTKDLRLEDYLLTPKGDRRGPLKIMLSGVLKIPYGTLGVDKDFKYQILIVAIDQTTSEIYQGKMNRFGERTPAIRIPGYEETKKGLDSQENFNVDLVHNLDLPIAAAKYTVYAVFGDYKSNVLEVDVDIR